MKWIGSIFGGVFFLLTGCSGIMPKEYEAETPALDIRRYLNGELEAWGTLSDWKGKVVRRFQVSMTGTWQGDVGTLEERFVFNDGEHSARTWTIRFTNEHRFTAKAADVVGSATGEQYGNAVNMRYVLRVPVGGKEYDIAMNDWLYLINDEVLINRTTMKKFGITVGELAIAFRKKS